VRALTIGGWFRPLGAGEQVFFGRGETTYGPLGERLFRPSDAYISFCLGTDQRGFFLGAINGNGNMPFPHVTIHDVPSQSWQQLVIVKDEKGHQCFYRNGALVHTDRRSMHAPSNVPWRETEAGRRQPIYLQMPRGGRIGEVWIHGRVWTADEVRADFDAQRKRYPGELRGPAVVPLREMHSHPPADDAFDRTRADGEFRKLLGTPPGERAPLDPELLGEEDCGDYVRRKVSLQVEADDRMPLYLLIPKRRDAKSPAVICFYGTTSGAGKLTTVGLSGRKTGDPPHVNLSFAVDLVRAGFIAVAADYLRDGERIAAGDAPYDTTRFYEKHPDWSVHGKDAWDTSRIIDYLETLDFVDPKRIGMTGHSYGGHSTIFTAAIEPRIRAAAANGPVSAFREHGLHWAVPKGARSSQSLPNLRPYLLDPASSLPVTFAEVTALIAPRPLWVGQAAGEHRPREEENYGFVRSVYVEAGAAERVYYAWYAGDHDFPPEARAAMVAWFRRWLREK
jgi:dienelactone hydrolase